MLRGDDPSDAVGAIWRSGRPDSLGRTQHVVSMAMELFTIYTRLAFGATMILAALCALLELIAGAL